MSVKKETLEEYLNRGGSVKQMPTRYVYTPSPRKPLKTKGKSRKGLIS